MEKALSTAILTIAAITIAMVLTSSLVPAADSGGRALLGLSGRLEERMLTDMALLHAAAETDVTGQTYVRVWLKNTGSVPIVDVERMDLILIGSGSVSHHVFGTGIGKWQYQVLHGLDEWIPGATIRVDLPVATHSAGLYEVQIVSPSGSRAKDSFSL